MHLEFFYQWLLHQYYQTFTVICWWCLHFVRSSGYCNIYECLLATNDDVTFKCLAVTDATRNVPVCVCVFVVFAEVTTQTMSQLFYVIMRNINNIFAALWNCDRVATEVINEKLFFFVISKGIVAAFLGYLSYCSFITFILWEQTWENTITLS